MSSKWVENFLKVVFTADKMKGLIRFLNLSQA